MVGRAETPPWLQTDWILGQFGVTRDLAIPRYVDFVRAGVGLPSIWGGLRNQIFLGDEEFVLRAQTQTDQLNITEIPRAQRRPPAKSLNHYRETAGSTSHAMSSAYASGDYAMAEIARHFGVHYSTVSRAVRRSEIEPASACTLRACKT